MTVIFIPAWIIPAGWKIAIPDAIVPLVLQVYAEEAYTALTRSGVCGSHRQYLIQKKGKARS
jgi:hypothetical protein